MGIRKRRSYFLPEMNALAFFRESGATDSFWDNHWEQHDRPDESFRNLRTSRYIVRIIRRCLPSRASILEAGCGNGNLVYALQHYGWQVIGVDYAGKALTRTKRAEASLDLAMADVAALPFPDSAFDCCISLGVIEHFRDGYQKTASEMRRVLKPGGTAFVSFPRISFLRGVKIAMGAYDAILLRDLEKEREGFYQFAFDSSKVLNNFIDQGFSFIRKRAYGGIKGLTDEIGWPVRTWINRLQQYRGSSVSVRAFRKGLELSSTPLAGHMCLLVLRRV